MNTDLVRVRREFDENRTREISNDAMHVRVHGVAHRVQHVDDETLRRAVAREAHAVDREEKACRAHVEARA